MAAASDSLIDRLSILAHGGNLTSYYERTADGPWRINCRQEHYLKPTKEELQKRGYSVRKSAGRDSLNHALYRCKIGLPSYHNMSNDELRAHIRARGIDTAKVFKGRKKGTSRELITILEHADTKLQFSRFTDLPPELRNRVYDLYFAPFEQQVLHAPTQPPLTKVSRIVRQETILMFYSRCTFEIMFANRRARGPVSSAQLRLPHFDSSFVYSTLPHHFAGIRKLVITVLTVDDDEWKRQITCGGINVHRGVTSLCLKLHIPAGGMGIRIVDARTRDDNSVRELLKSRGSITPSSVLRFIVHAQLETAVSRDVKRERQWRLKQDDILRMRRHIESAMDFTMGT